MHLFSYSFNHSFIYLFMCKYTFGLLQGDQWLFPGYILPLVLFLVFTNYLITDFLFCLHLSVFVQYLLLCYVQYPLFVLCTSGPPVHECFYCC